MRLTKRFYEILVHFNTKKHTATDHTGIIDIKEIHQALP